MMSDKTPCGARTPEMARALAELDRLTTRRRGPHEVMIGCTKVLDVGPGRLVVASTVGSFEDESEAAEFRGHLEREGWSCRKIEDRAAPPAPVASTRTELVASDDRVAREAIGSVATWLAAQPDRRGTRDKLRCWLDTEHGTSTIYVSAPGTDLSERRTTLEESGWECVLSDDKGNAKD